MDITSTEYMYSELGISKEILELGRKTEAELKERFQEFDRTAEYNQLKVIRAMQENRVNEGCFQYASGYGYTIRGEIRWRLSMPLRFIRRQLLSVPRLPAGHMHWHCTFGKSAPRR